MGQARRAYRNRVVPFIPGFRLYQRANYLRRRRHDIGALKAGFRLKIQPYRSLYCPTVPLSTGPDIMPDGQDIALPVPQDKGRDNKSLLEHAYKEIEELIVTCQLRPGSYLRIRDLQDMTGYNRMPVYQAVTRLASDTLITIRPRQGVQIAPVDLPRTAILLKLRRDMERFLVTLACEKSSPQQRTLLGQISQAMEEQSASMSLSTFNRFDLQIDAQILKICDEPFLEYSLRPLHTMFRRIGWIYHTHAKPNQDLADTVHGHLGVLRAVLAQDAQAAAKASDRLMDFMGATVNAIERNVDPKLLNVGLELDTA
ncbi:GntR family transcriptional regulator [Salinicola halophyticus]|uniref:GntR family transcriptional regulator n=1 Tax=Salinicola halophyticus TaxID=1808881 RepID=UPI003F460C03